VQHILHGTYQFPLDTPPEVEALFLEAAELYGKTRNQEFSPYITVEEYQY
jgi:hypothetical protein